MNIEKIELLLRCMRPGQWPKNALIFAGIIFAGKISDPLSVYNAVRAFCAFCLMSSAIYLVNDLLDLEQDRQHPLKRNRPLASGKLDTHSAALAAAILAPLSLCWCFWISRSLGYCGLAYLLLSLGYTLVFKHVLIVDLLALALGFVIRAFAGIAALNIPGQEVPVTEWFIACVFFLALFVVICKRRHEIDLLRADAQHHRAVLALYSRPFLDKLVSISTASAVLTYALYAIEHGKGLIYTLVFVIYGVFHYLHRVYHGSEGGAPEQTLLRDPAMLINGALWLASMFYIYYFVK